MYPPTAAQYPLAYTQESVEGQAGKAVPLRHHTYHTGSRCSEPFPTHLPFSTYLHTPNRQSVGVGDELEGPNQHTRRCVTLLPVSLPGAVITCEQTGEPPVEKALDLFPGKTAGSVGIPSPDRPTAGYGPFSNG